MNPQKKGITIESIIELRKRKIQDNAKEYQNQEAVKKPPVKSRKVT